MSLQKSCSEVKRNILNTVIVEKCTVCATSSRSKVFGVFFFVETSLPPIRDVHF